MGFDMRFGMQRWRGGLRYCALGCFLISGFAAVAQTNSWTKPTSGRWDDVSAWSLGILPGSSQSVFIQRTNPTTVLIDRNTAQGYKASFSVQSLTLGTSNTLVMSNTGEEALTAANGISFNGGALMISNAVVSALMSGSNGVVVQTGGLAYGGLVFNNGNYFLTNGEFWGDVRIDGGSFMQSGDGASLKADSFAGNLIQNGGFASISNASLFGGGYTLNSGQMQCGSADAIDAVNQNGGAANFSSLRVDWQYNLNAGLLQAANLDVSSVFDGGQFVQQGGSNEVGTLDVDYGSTYKYLGGSLRAGDVSLIAGGAYDVFFQQRDTTAVITNRLYMEGSGYHYPWFGTPAIYDVTNGVLYAGSIVLEGGGGNCELNLIDSTVSVAGPIQINGLTWAPGNLLLSGGLLTCSNVVNNGGTEFVQQTGGAFVVTNRFVYGGYYPVPMYPLPWPMGHAVYTFSAGTISATDIELDAEMMIGDSAQSSRITNTGHFQLAGILDVGNANEQLGRFVLASQTITNIDQGTTFVTNNAFINFTGNSTVLAFADSHSETWSNAATLLVSNWNGSVNGGGNEQLRFGGNPSGLKPAQMSQIRFVNPTGFSTGTYAARILSTGEVVPYAPEVSAARSGNGLVIAWPDSSYTLQAATNVTGPWTNVVGASSPYTNSFAGGPQEFFRLTR